MSAETFLQMQNRRRFLRNCVGGLSTIALWNLLALEGRTAETSKDSNPLRLRPPHFPPRAKNVIFLFMSGAPSQLDLMDPKPAMQKWHGQPMPVSMLGNSQDAAFQGFRSSSRVMASPRTFQKYGKSGMEFSDFLPHMGSVADDLCLIRSLHTDVSNHDPAQLLMNCGSPLAGHPSMGSWVNYGLGSVSQDLPGFVVLMSSSSGKGVDGGAANWSNGFLPSSYRGVTFRSSGDPVLHLSNPRGISAATQRTRLDVLRDLNQQHLQATGDLEIASRIESYELAFRMQSAAPELLDFSKESKETLALYGIDQEKTKPFGTNCLLARRMVERGVRFVQLYHSTWDDHSDLNKNLQLNCAMTDQPAAALIKDLKQRGLLDDTLVIWGGEFGRTPTNEIRLGSTPGKEGRDHHTNAFTMWMAGGGIKPGQIVGRTDEFGYQIAEDPIHVHDLQATILHCLGMDHTRLTYRHQGRDFRLTDVAGRVVEKLLA